MKNRVIRYQLLDLNPVDRDSGRSTPTLRQNQSEGFFQVAWLPPMMILDDDDDDGGDDGDDDDDVSSNSNSKTCIPTL